MDPATFTNRLRAFFSRPLSVIVFATLLYPETSPAVLVAAAAELPAIRGSLTLDGAQSESFWRSSAEYTLAPAETGVPQETGGSFRLVRSGAWLCLIARLPEKDGRVLAFSQGYNPEWTRDSNGSPAAEDRLQLRIAAAGKDPEQGAAVFEVNPWGAVRVSREGGLVARSGFMAAAAVGREGWVVEAAVPLDEAAAGSDGPLSLTVTRIRSRRPLDPEFHWQRTVEVSRPVISAADRNLGAPSYAPPLLGNREEPLVVGRVQKAPALDSDWENPDWQAVGEIELPANEFPVRRPDYQTLVRLVHDGRTLTAFFRCTEDERVDCEVGERDGDVAGDDHVFLCLAASGSALVEVQVNPAETARDALARGPHRYSSGSGAWNGDIRTHCDIFSDHWTARVDIPLDQAALALGELPLPENWRIILGRVRRGRPGDPAEISSLPVTGSANWLAPARFRRMVLGSAPAQGLSYPKPVYPADTLGGLAKQIAGLSPFAFSRVERKYHGFPDMLSSSAAGRIRELAMREHAEWDSVATLADWEAFRGPRVKALRSALGEFPASRPPLAFQVTASRERDGYVLQNVVYQSRPGDFVAANLFLPSHPPVRMPGIIIIPSQHYPKTQGEMQDCGIVWARTGCAVLVIERLASGERTETLPWYRQNYQSEYLTELQLDLVGQSRMGWMAWDAIRAVDLFYELGNIDTDRIILIGSVAGGGIPAALAAAFDDRIDAVIPFNFGRVYWWDWGIRGSLANRITPWFMYNLAAPRKFIYAHEFSWEGEEGPEYPEVWVPAWPRYRKVYELYDAQANLATTQGTGLLRVQATAGDCWSVGPVQREPVYHVLERWFGIPLPRDEDRRIRIDSGLGFTRLRPDYAAIVEEENRRRLPETELLSITPGCDAGLERRALHEIARDMAQQFLAAARKQRAELGPAELRRTLAETLTPLLGNIDPEPAVKADRLRVDERPSMVVEVTALHTEEGIIVPLYLIRPKNAPAGPLPVVVAIAEHGKRGFLENRAPELAELVERGVAVCLPDLRGTGETAPERYNRGAGDHSREVSLGRTLLGSRLKDLRSVLAWLWRQDRFTPAGTALWGESFADANLEPIYLDELANWQVGPVIQRYASPLGSQLALLAALYQPEIAAVAAGGGLSGYLSVLDDAFAYLPPDVIVPKILKYCDVPDVCASLAPAKLLLYGMVDGKNYPVPEAGLAEFRETVERSCARAGGTGNLTVLGGKTDGAKAVSWLAGNLNR